MTRLSQFKAYSLTADPNFEVVGCNGADNIPELTLRIKKNYFESNLSWQTGFTLTGWGPWNGTGAFYSVPSETVVVPDRYRLGVPTWD